MSPMERLIDILPVFIIFPVIFMIIRAILDHYTRKRLIEKGLVGEEVKKFFENGADRYVSSSLKWGIVLTFIGVAVVVMRLASEFISSELAIGIMLIAAGMGLLLYYFIAQMNILNQRKQLPSDKAE